MEGDRRVFRLPGTGLTCFDCGTVLPEVDRTIARDGFVMRDRLCPKCGVMNRTTERVIGARTIRSRRIVIHRDEFL